MLTYTYNIVDTKTGEVVAERSNKYSANDKVFELNNSENGYKYKAELSDVKLPDVA